MRQAALAVSLAWALAGAASAAPAWTVDPAASKLGFSGSFGGDAFQGMFHRWSAQIAFDPHDLATSKAVVSVDMTSASTGDRDRDQALPTDDWFAAKAHPQASFVAIAFKDLGGGRYQAQGVLSLRGVSRPVTLPFTLAIAGGTARMTGAVNLDRTAFGVGQGQWKTGEVVAIPVTVSVSLTAHRR